MTNVVKRIGILLLAGLLLNALVVIVIAATVNVYADMAVGGMAPHGGVHWEVHASRNLGAERVIWIERPEDAGRTLTPPGEVIPGWLAIEPPTAESLDGAQQRQRTYVAMGWPVRCVWCVTAATTLLADGTGLVEGAVGGVDLPLTPWKTMGGQTRPRIIPLRPIWTGLLVNVLCFAVLAGLLGVLLDGTRQLHRFKRGVCPACRHDVAHDYTHGCRACGWHPPGRDGLVAHHL